MRKAFDGATVATRLNGSINNSTLTVNVDDASTYPSGLLPFVIAVNRGTATEEKMLVASRSSNTLTISQRGYDGTVAQNHADDATVEHVLDADTVDEANLLANTMTTNGDIIMRAAGAPARLAIGAVGQLLRVSSSNLPEWATVASTLASLTDVVIAGAVNGQVLTWNSSTSKWVNQTLPSSVGSDLFLFQNYR